MHFPKWKWKCALLILFSPLMHARKLKCIAEVIVVDQAKNWRVCISITWLARKRLREKER